MCITFPFSKKAKKEDVGISFNQPKTAFRSVFRGSLLQNVRISYVYKHMIIFVLHYYVNT